MKFKKIVIILLLLLLPFSFNRILLAQDENNNDENGQVEEQEEKLNDLRKKIEEYESKIKELKGEEQTLSSAIAYLDSQINLTSAQIAATEQELVILDQEISKLDVKIDILDESLEDVSAILSSRIEETYKRSAVNPFYLIVSSTDFKGMLSRIKYLKIVQAHDRELLLQMQKSKMNYDSQKTVKEEKQEQEETLKAQLESQQAVLAQQKAQKNELLEVTKNDEQKFQNLLAAARAEMQAIQSIMAGYGEEVEVRAVNEGERIASVISGLSACSTGTHLHFEVANGDVNVNPAGYLSSKGVSWDLCGWYGCDEQFGFSGSWAWPMNDPITITQGYGMTAYAKSGAYGGNPHSGIDMYADNLTVKAVKNGTLYRGSIPCGGGTLRYVKVDHTDSNIDTYYLHVNY